MNRNYTYIAITLAFVITTVWGCQSNKQKNNASETTQDSLTVTYSNLLDKPTQEEVAQVMSEAGISPENVASFLQNVNQFNDAVEGQNLVSSGFVKLDTLLPHYDEMTIETRWNEKHPHFFGYNCRITSFDLLHDFITVDQPLDERSTILNFDEETLDNCGRTLFSPSERKAFRTLFAPVPTPYKKDIDKHLQNMQSYWQSRGIRFIHKGDSTKASLISVVLHSAITPDESYLFVGHVGVLIPTGKQLLFVEKLAFQTPYQAIRFNNRSELNDYLMRLYDVEWNQPTASPILMENDELLEGYRPNPDKRTEN
ncbi:DUF4300 family protein [Tannerella sp.]|uniref:DUF4300 family protein n=1 Tax=Tannerella sp. TaxID=2382127 RepID=UPI0026DCB6B8|nr:DUF4300 family protein [Tannerella sp.]MDO4703241.1 DUF4300 family protein [Tannerella sp.]